MDVPVPVLVVVGLAFVTLVAIVIAPSRRVRSERRLPSEVETRVLGECEQRLQARRRAEAGGVVLPRVLHERRRHRVGLLLGLAEERQERRVHVLALDVLTT